MAARIDGFHPQDQGFLTPVFRARPLFRAALLFSLPNNLPKGPMPLLADPFVLSRPSPSQGCTNRQAISRGGKIG